MQEISHTRAPVWWHQVGVSTEHPFWDIRRWAIESTTSNWSLHEIWRGRMVARFRKKEDATLFKLFWG